MSGYNFSLKILISFTKIRYILQIAHVLAQLACIHNTDVFSRVLRANNAVVTGKMTALIFGNEFLVNYPGAAAAPGQTISIRFLFLRKKGNRFVTPFCLFNTLRS
jgi:hypothetical protein